MSRGASGGVLGEPFRALRRALLGALGTAAPPAGARTVRVPGGGGDGAPPVIRRLLVTGAAGGVAAALRPMLAARYPVLRLADVRRVAALAPSDEVVRCDLADRAAVGRLVRGCDAVLHLGAVAKEADYARLERANMAGTYHLLDAAVDAGVRRVVLASTMHVLGMYPRAEPLPDGAPPRPDSLYAVSKLFAEQLGRLYADKYGLEVACLRIGAFGPCARTAEPGAWIGADALFALAAALLERPGLRYEVVPAVAEHADDEALAAAAVRYARDPVARHYRGGEFASATGPMG